MKHFHIALALTLLSFAVPAHAQTTYPLYCRGPLQFVTGTGDPFFSWTTIFFTKAPTVAGSRGSALAEGTCSWPDRVISPDEPSRILLSEYKLLPKSDEVPAYQSPNVPTFLACNQNERCTFMVRVYNNGAGSFLVGSTTKDVMWVYYPFLP